MNVIEDVGAFDEKSTALKWWYTEICSHIRTTDEISFKLLGLVPLVSGIGIVVLLDRSKQPAWSPMVVFVGLFGALVTFAIYRWEVRNLMTCDWLIHLARTLEQDQLGLANGQFHNRPAPHIFGYQVGKRQAEHLLYWTTITAWLLLPVIAAVTQ
jgi:xanthosine utilization system XapX-like protein